VSGEFKRISFIVYLHKCAGTLWVDDLSLVEGKPAAGSGPKKAE